MNALILLLYILLTGCLVGAAALLLERTMIRLGRPARWLWLGALGLSAWLALAAMFAPPPPPAPQSLAPFEMESGPLPGVVATGPATTESVDAEGAPYPSRIGALLSDAASRLPVIVVPRRALVAGWAAISLLVGAGIVGVTLHMRRRARRWQAARLCGRFVRLSTGEGPATFGVVDPEIVVPSWMRSMPAEELELVLRHEEEHVRAGDTRLLTAALVTACLVPWNPLTWWQLRRLRHAVEVDCDRRVLRGGAPAVRYGELLLRVGLHGRMRVIPAPAIAGSRSSLERRLTAMRDAHSRIRPLPLVAAIGGAGVLVALACTGEPPTAAPQAERSTLATESSEPRFDVNGDPLVQLELDAAGTLRLNGKLQEISTLAEALEPIATRETVVAVQVHPRTAYSTVSEVTDQVRMVGLLRVIFAQEAVEEAYAFVLPPLAPVPPAPPVRGPVEIDGVRVEPTAPAAPATAVPPRNLLHMRVLPDGAIRVWRGDDEGDGQFMLTAQLTRMLRLEHTRNANTIAVLLAGAETPYRSVYEALGAIQQSPVTRYSIQLVETGPL